MRVGIVSDGLCYPPTAGNRIRTLNLMVRLARRHEVTYFARGSGHPAADREATHYLSQRGIGVVLTGELPPPRSGFGFYASVLMNLVASAPFSVASWRSNRLERAVRQRAAGGPDLWQFESLTHAGLAPRLLQPSIMMAHNVESLIWARYAATEPRPLKRRYLELQRGRMERWEGRVFRSCARVVTVSEPDAALARARYGVGHVDVVDNGIDRGYFEPTRADRDPKQILFLGSLEWRPNQDAVRLLLGQIFPRVTAAEPTARLTIVGRSAPNWLLRLASEVPGVEVHTDVPDVRPYLAGCGALAVPLRVGGGSRLKILEALACGTPVVSTRVGAEGLDIRSDEHFIEADEGVMAEALVQVIRNPAGAREKAEQGRQLVYERYDWDGLATKLEQVWVSCVSRKQVPTRHGVAS